MTGKLCDGVKDFNAKLINNSRAFCEGVAARTLAVPPAVNPHPADSEAGQAYVAGVSAAAANAGSPMPPDEAPCCAVSTADVAS
jgi:hypothetical protein